YSRMGFESTYWRRARDYQRPTLPRSTSNREASCHMDQITPTCTGAPLTMSTKFCAGRSRGKFQSSSPGVGPLLATALVANVADPRAFRSGRNFSAWIGLVPKQHSSGGKDRLGSISKQGDRYLCSLFVAGALSVIRYAKAHGSKHRPWLTALLARR